MNNFQAFRSDAAFRNTRGHFTSGELDELRPHVVNLTRGGLSSGGVLSTTESDILEVRLYSERKMRLMLD